MCEKHDTTAPTRWHICSDRHSAGGTPGGQQGLRMAKTGQESGGSGAKMETSQMPALGLCLQLKSEMNEIMTEELN